MSPKIRRRRAKTPESPVAGGSDEVSELRRRAAELEESMRQLEASQSASARERDRELLTRAIARELRRMGLADHRVDDVAVAVAADGKLAMSDDGTLVPVDAGDIDATVTLGRYRSGFAPLFEEPRTLESLARPAPFSVDSAVADIMKMR